MQDKVKDYEKLAKKNKKSVKNVKKMYKWIAKQEKK